MPFTQLYRQVKDSVVQVIAPNGQTPVSFGTGSVIDDGLKVLTCAHCIVPNTTTAIVDPRHPNQAISESVLFSDVNLDIAILEFQQAVGTSVAFTNSNNCTVGNGAAVIGYLHQDLAGTWCAT
ncbi:S1 family peptidase [Desulfoscipio geothermicus]|uniref:Trypsin-like peptidase domain-containing protein n=1 Tax=Desulfoscipio geothermicus DSM 3669 TaxID=1121426 RepID=A0A1I6DIS4_9FIRM|nr:serine protease [Desulfoscipio geothermicus]SFR05287.1 Trypsin-like peptidase domain-containing protein [Desulfoscipio geothermicus DSM 3669]